MNKDTFWEEYRSVNKSELLSWMEGLSPIEKNKTTEK